MNSSSAIAILRRFSAGIRRSVVNSDHSRMMSSTGAVSSTKLPWVFVFRAPSNSHVMNFYCIAKKEFYSILGNTYWFSWDIVGSSHGWLGFYDRKSKRPLFSHPTTDRLVDLPSLTGDEGVGRLILEEKGRLAFMTFGSGASKIAFCSPCRSNNWNIFNEREGEGEGGRVFEDVLHSSWHDRLFCLVGEEESTKLECWKVDQCQIESSREDPPPPILEWTMVVDVGDEKKKEKEKEVKYVVCDEDTGKLYLVVRHVEVNRNWRNADFQKFSSYTTLDIKVYRIDWERREVMLMEDSLNGLSMFVGMNQSFAMVASEVPGLNPDSVYFGSDDRLTPPEESFGGFDNHKRITGSGVFDYRKRTLSPLFNLILITPQEDPVWFTPRPISPSFPRPLAPI